MNAEGHKKKADEIGDSLDKLLPDPEGEHVVAIVELTYGAAIHLIAFGMENKYNKHLDTHVGLPRELRKLGEIDIAMIFETMDMFRAGRWYGSKGNGDVVGRCLGFIEKMYVFRCGEKTTRFHEINTRLRLSDIGHWLVLYFISYFFILSRENLCNLVVS